MPNIIEHTFLFNFFFFGLQSRDATIWFLVCCTSLTQTKLNSYWVSLEYLDHKEYSFWSQETQAYDRHTKVIENGNLRHSTKIKVHKIKCAHEGSDTTQRPSQVAN